MAYSQTVRIHFIQHEWEDTFESGDRGNELVYVLDDKYVARMHHTRQSPLPRQSFSCPLFLSSTLSHFFSLSLSLCLSLHRHGESEGVIAVGSGQKRQLNLELAQAERQRET